MMDEDQKTALEGPEPIILPLWAREKQERDYRRGFLHGVAGAVSILFDMSRKGWTIQEAQAALENWELDAVSQWRADIRLEPHHGTPTLEVTPKR